MICNRSFAPTIDNCLYQAHAINKLLVQMKIHSPQSAERGFKMPLNVSFIFSTEVFYASLVFLVSSRLIQRSISINAAQQQRAQHFASAHWGCVTTCPVRRREADAWGGVSNREETSRPLNNIVKHTDVCCLYSSLHVAAFFLNALQSSKVYASGV